MIRSRLLIGGAAAALALSAAALAVAQETQQPPPWRAEMRQRMQARREQALTDLRQVLRLRPDQEAAFQALQAALRPPAREPQPQPPGELTTPQLIARRAERFAAVKAQMDRRDQAILAFYGRLSPEQQKTFDSLVRLRRGGPLLEGGMGMGMRHMRMGAWRGRPDGPPPPPR